MSKESCREASSGQGAVMEEKLGCQSSCVLGALFWQRRVEDEGNEWGPLGHVCTAGGSRCFLEERLHCLQGRKRKEIARQREQKQTFPVVCLERQEDCPLASETQLKDLPTKLWAHPKSPVLSTYFTSLAPSFSFLMHNYQHYQKSAPIRKLKFCSLSRKQKIDSGTMEGKGLHPRACLQAASAKPYQSVV